MNDIERLQQRIQALRNTANWMEERGSDPKTIAKLRATAVEEQAKLDRLTGDQQAQS
jgi:hypothetical protein